MYARINDRDQDQNIILLLSPFFSFQVPRLTFYTNPREGIYIYVTPSPFEKNPRSSPFPLFPLLTYLLTYLLFHPCFDLLPTYLPFHLPIWCKHSASSHPYRIVHRSIHTHSLTHSLIYTREWNKMRKERACKTPAYVTWGFCDCLLNEWMNEWVWHCARVFFWGEWEGKGGVCVACVCKKCKAKQSRSLSFAFLIPFFIEGIWGSTDWEKHIYRTGTPFAESV